MCWRPSSWRGSPARCSPSPRPAGQPARDWGASRCCLRAWQRSASASGSSCSTSRPKADEAQAGQLPPVDAPGSVWGRAIGFFSSCAPPSPVWTGDEGGREETPSGLTADLPWAYSDAMMAGPHRRPSVESLIRMTFDRVAIVEAALDASVEQAASRAAPLAPDAPLREGSGLTARKALELFEDQVASRQLDVAARELKNENRSFYTIGSAGHENNAVIGAQLRITDPAFLHYRSGAFMMARARQLPGTTPVFDALLGIVASSEDPIAQGRHKVWGSRPLWVPPQTSTIASHLPKAMGLAFSLARARRLGVAVDLPDDSIVACSFGDASVNHATALSAFNTARYGVKIGLPMPILFICEDNDVGISVPTPHGWIAETFGNQPNLRYWYADGEIDEIWEVAEQAIHFVRSSRRPAFLHLKTVRLWGPAGSDREHVHAGAD